MIHPLLLLLLLRRAVRVGMVRVVTSSLIWPRSVVRLLERKIAIVGVLLLLLAHLIVHR